MNIIKYISGVLVLTLLLFIGCKPKSIDIEVPEAEPKIVVNSFAIEGFMIIILTKSFSPLLDTTDTDYFEKLAIKGANVTVIDPIQKVDFFEIPDSLDGPTGVYFGAVEAKPNFSYTLQVETENLGEAWATTEMLEQVENYDFSLSRNTDKPNYITVNYSLTDVSSGHDFYAIAVSGASQESLLPSIDTLRNLNTSQYELIDDLTYTNEISGSFELIAAKNDTLSFSLSHISEPYYKYLQVLKKGSNIFSSITKEPINYPTNVHHGLGFFNAFFPQVEPIIVEE